ncbi:MAG: hypothetical protein K6T94_08030 [Paenibacillus sp.]|nr:hypothetical protein [Paenibacillus sp.]
MSNTKRVEVFDEPTASSDPLTEAEVFKTFLNATNKCTSILVTHRIGPAKLADRIIVMKDGEIIEEGTHELLI